MTIRLALRRGLRAVSRAPRMWFIFYTALTLAAMLPAAVVTTIAFQSLGQSAWAEELGRRLDLEWIGELMAAYGGMPSGPIMAALVAAALISVMVHLFLLGGAIETFVRRQWFSAALFFGGCGRNFWRLFRLAIYCLIPLAAVVGINIGLSNIGDKIWGKGSEAAPLIHWSWLNAAVTLLLLGFVNAIFDYTAIHLVAEDRRKAFRGMWRSFRFVWRHVGRVAGLAAVLWAIALAVLTIYFGVSKLFPQHSVGVVLLLLFVRQAFVLARIWSRLLFYASQYEVYDAAQVEPIVQMVSRQQTASGIY